jgi:hypothetical protein
MNTPSFQIQPSARAQGLTILKLHDQTPSCSEPIFSEALVLAFGHCNRFFSKLISDIIKSGHRLGNFLLFLAVG